MKQMLTLTAAELRVLGSLIEKEMTTPEYYPLSLNALVNACNQKSSRDPVMELTEADVRTALFELENLGLVRVLADARVSKFEHRVYDKLSLRRPEVTLLGLLLLRGPQTAAELRARAERMYSFDDNAAVTATLERMAQRGANNPHGDGVQSDGAQGPLVVLGRQPGARESRWMHRLGGDAENVQRAAAPAEHRAAENDRLAQLEDLVRELEARISALESR